MFILCTFLPKQIPSVQTFMAIKSHFDSDSDCQMFLVRRGLDQKAMLLSVRLADLQGKSQIQDVTVTEEKSCEYLCKGLLTTANRSNLV